MNVETTRLHIRDLVEEDWQALHALRTDPSVYRYNHFGPETEDETRTWLSATMYHNGLQPRLSYNCAVVLKTTGQVIGWIGFGVADPYKQQYGKIDFGYALLPAFWNHGYMTEALRATLEFIFVHTTATQVFGEYLIGNVASARVMEKAGMQRVARFRDPAEGSPDQEDSYRYSIKKQEWQAQQWDDAAN